MTTTAIHAQKAGAKARSRKYWPKLDGVHPMVQELFRLIYESHLTLSAACKRAGLGERTIQGWKKQSPTMDRFDAVLRTVGYKLAIVSIANDPIDKRLPINLNDEFAVKLTDTGEHMLREALTIRRSDGAVITAPEKMMAVCYPPRPDGKRIFQLHELMRFFGPMMFVGNPSLPIEMEIEPL